MTWGSRWGVRPGSPEWRFMSEISQERFARVEEIMASRRQRQQAKATSMIQDRDPGDEDGDPEDETSSLAGTESSR